MFILNDLPVPCGIVIRIDFALHYMMDFMNNVLSMKYGVDNIQFYYYYLLLRKDLNFLLLSLCYFLYYVYIYYDIGVDD